MHFGAVSNLIAASTTGIVGIDMNQTLPWMSIRSLSSRESALRKDSYGIEAIRMSSPI